jgi:phosphate transport system permease protein
MIILADGDGRVYRYDIRDLNAPFLAETADLFPRGTRLTALGFLAGEQSIVAGASDGSVGIYFRVAREDAGETRDGHKLVLARKLAPHGKPVTGLAVSRQGKVVITADGAGVIWMRHGTSEKTILRLTGGRKEWAALALAPRDDAVLALQPDGRGWLWTVAVPHPETSLHTLFGKVWYEGYPEPTYTWQSSAATDVFEPKLSLVPLIFGTIKGTFYSLLFAVPIALLGAIYTSEFLHRRVRAVVKPIMEMMASLPSVVLGFVAALVLAPVVESWIAAVVLAFLVVPLSLVTGAYLWQLLPGSLALRLQGVPKFLLMLVPLGAGIHAAFLAGPAFERWFFGGSFKLWAGGSGGNSWPLLALMLFPLGLILASMTARRMYGKGLTDLMGRQNPLRAGLLSLAHWIGVVGMGGLGAYVAALLLEGLGTDVRSGFVGTYVQRNTLVVGFAMGFAVIPLIYTLAEDALSAVPEHLRAASLSCGATLWQTALWVVVPTAVSGLFSAVMIGMGRAVGETMIVVMATGNTPIMDWNVFNGLRALSANIAVELPEAVKDGTLYRVLFLSGLVLFAMTFVINTLAEVIRQRFRKRAMQL